ncbi:hypothetical protein ACFLVR_01925 [Chloroflexota bacterium]
MGGKIKKVIRAFLLALMLGILGITSVESSADTAMFSILFVVGLISFSILLFKVKRTGFWFCLVYAIEWLLLPILAYAYATQWSGSGVGGVGAGIALGLIVYLLMLVGGVGFIIFVALAFLRFRKSS